VPQGHQFLGVHTQRKINAQASTTITARVKISAPAGSFRTTTATVSPADSTPGDNTDRDAVKIHSN
jgi:hypothetical protein